jgi:shikimate kinase
VILLKASLPVLWERVCQKKDRPLLNTPDPKGSLKKIFESREERYQSTCDQAILTDGLTPDAVAKQILGLLK